MSAPVITGPGIYQMRNGETVEIIRIEGDTAHIKHVGDGNVTFSVRWGQCSYADPRFDIIRRVADLPVVEERIAND